MQAGAAGARDWQPRPALPFGKRGEGKVSGGPSRGQAAAGGGRGRAVGTASPLPSPCRAGT